MKIAKIIWLDDIVEKIAQKNQVQRGEVREALSTSSHFRFIEYEKK